MAQKTRIEVSIDDTGFWHIDNQSGKWMCIVTIECDGEKLSHVPSHEWCKEYLDKMLESEWRNDNFVFMDGRYGKYSKRPPQLWHKLDEL